MAGERFPKSDRIRSRAAFLRLQSSGRKVEGPLLTALYQPNGLGHPRVGFTVSRRVGNAVVRNRTRRILRESFRRARAKVPAVDLVLIARPAASAAGHDALREAFSNLCQLIRQRECASEAMR